MNLCGKITECILLLLLTVLIVMFSLSPGSTIAPAVRLVGGDKIAHFLAYSALGFWTYISLGSVFKGFREKASRRFYTAVLYCILVGGIMEVLQPWFGRTMSFTDFLMDAAGGIAGALLGVLSVRGIGKDGGKDNQPG